MERTPLCLELTRVSQVLLLDIKSPAVSILRYISKLHIDSEQLSEVFLRLYTPCAHVHHVHCHKMTI